MASLHSVISDVWQNYFLANNFITLVTFEWISTEAAATVSSGSFHQTKQSRGETSFDCFVKVKKIGFPFSFSSTRPFESKKEKKLGQHF